MLCPRRNETPLGKPTQGEQDSFKKLDTDPLSKCSYCGSLNPADFMALAKSGVQLMPTDKTYKVYVRVGAHGQTKFYFQHLSQEQMAMFVELYNSHDLVIATPGDFHVLPFFMKRLM